MNSAPLNDCGCCEGVEPQTPVLIANASGRRVIAYRCGTHAQFKQSMLAALSNSAYPALRGLATRDDDDFSIALIDAWATTADVLTFYQERIAQESYLRTATERESLLQLGRLIGYELRPGVAASTFLAFTLETAPGAPPAVTIKAGNKVQSVPGPGEKPQTFETVEQIEARPEWNDMRVRHTQLQRIDANTTVVHLEGTATQLRKGDTLLFVATGVTALNPAWDLCRVQSSEADQAKNVTRMALYDRPLKFEVPRGGSVRVFAMRQRAGLFGHNAPDPRVLTSDTRTSFPNEISEGDSIGDWIFRVNGDALDLDGTYPTIAVGSLVALTAPGERALVQVRATNEAGRRDYTLSGTVTRLSVTEIGRAEPANLAKFSEVLRGTTVLAEIQELKLAEVPVAPVISGNQLVVTQRIEGFVPGRRLAITGHVVATDASFGAVVTLVEAAAAGANTAIRFAPALPELEVESIRINANVALATHGETVGETLGGADASRPFQRFALRHAPLTHVRAASASGATSTLQVRVNDLLWHEVAGFLGLGAHDRVFVTRTADDGATSVQFGDGVTGARPPSGLDNVRALYRRGTGLEGLVKAGQLTTLLTRPPGAKGVNNPVAAAGAADREQLSDARQNAPLTVMTLDRIVSLQDYEDFIRAFAGVAKAFATWTWDGEARGVFVTVAGPGGDELDMEGDFGRNLLAAVHRASLPGVPVRVQSYQKAASLFTLSARVKLDPDSESDRVRAAVRENLAGSFSFDARSFGEPVHLSEIIAAIQSTPGVVAVDVDELRRLAPPAAVQPALSPVRANIPEADLRTVTSSRAETPFTSSPSRIAIPSRPNARLVAAVPQAGTRGRVSPAELLVLAPLAPERIGVMS